MQVVQAYIRDTASYPWVWGVSDCMMWSAGLVFEVTGKDIAGDLRETYSSALAAARVVKAEGGAVSLIQNRTDGLLRPGIGAEWGVGVVGHKDFGQAACILSNGVPMVKTDGGVMPYHSPLLASWAF